MTHSRAFTLIEILLVVVIMAIVAAMAVPNFSRGYGMVQLRRAADDLKARVRWAQAMAMGQHRQYRLEFLQEGRCQVILRAKEGEAGKDAAYEAAPGRAGKTQCVPSEMALAADPPVMVLYADGTMDPVEIKLSSGRHQLILSSMAKRGALVVIHEE